MRLGRFFENAEIGKSGRQLDSELAEVATETRKRVVNHNTVDDQQHRAKNLRDARGRIN